MVIGDPLDSLGMEGEGSPLRPARWSTASRRPGLFSERAWVVPHHARKESVQDAVDEAAGAWSGRPDALLALEKRKDDQARLTFAKVRWQGRERNPYLLDFDPETEAFTFVKEEEGEERDYAVEVEEVLSGKTPMTSTEIAKEIGASRDKVEEILRSTPTASTRSPERPRRPSKAPERGPLVSCPTPEARRARQLFPRGCRDASDRCLASCSPRKGTRQTTSQHAPPTCQTFVLLLPRARRDAGGLDDD